jgi:hypothetical protein
MISLLDERPRVALARITLLDVRAGLSRAQADGPVPPNRFLLPDGRRVLEVESAAMELARLPGPLVLTARVEDGVIHVEHGPEAWMAERVWEPPMFGKYARRRKEPYEELPVCCVGADEALLVRAGVVEAWRREHSVALQGGFSGGPPSAFLGTLPRLARQAYEAGAVCILQFDTARKPLPEDTGDVIVLRRMRRWEHPRVLEHVPSGAPCVFCGTDAAEWRETETWMQPWRERRICSRCVADRLAPRALRRAKALDEWYRELTPAQVRELRDEIAGEVHRLARHFRRLPMPPEVAALVQRWGGR